MSSTTEKVVIDRRGKSTEGQEDSKVVINGRRIHSLRIVRPSVLTLINTMTSVVESKWCLLKEKRGNLLIGTQIRKGKDLFFNIIPLLILTRSLNSLPLL